MGRSRWLAIILYAVAVGLGSAGCGDDDKSSTGSVSNISYAEESFSVRLAVSAQSGIGIAAISGTVAVTGVSGLDSAEISGIMRVGSSSLADAEAYLDSLDVIVENGQTQILIETSQPDSTEGRVLTVDYTIRIPDYFIVTCSQVAGDVELDEVGGGTVVGLISGDITGTARLPQDGTINLNIVAGTIDLRIPVSTSAQFYAHITNGSIVTTNLTFTNEVRLPNQVNGTLGSGDGTIMLEVVSGGIVVTGFLASTDLPRTITDRGTFHDSPWNASLY